MSKAEPKVKASIIARPSYNLDKEISDKNSVRWIGEIYVNGKMVYQTTDFDWEGDPLLECSNHLYRYQKKHNSCFIKDAKLGRIKK